MTSKPTLAQGFHECFLVETERVSDDVEQRLDVSFSVLLGLHAPSDFRSRDIQPEKSSSGLGDEDVPVVLRGDRA